MLLVLDKISVHFFVMETLLWTVVFARLHLCCSYAAIEIQQVNAMEFKVTDAHIMPLLGSFKML